MSKPRRKNWPGLGCRVFVRYPNPEDSMTTDAPRRLETYGETMRRWLEELMSAAQAEKVLRGGDLEQDGEEWTFRFRLHTRTAEYTITARDDYLGCIARIRCWRQGERHHRGNDLPDGDFSEETWNEILRGILWYELRVAS